MYIELTYLRSENNKVISFPLRGNNDMWLSCNSAQMTPGR